MCHASRQFTDAFYFLHCAIDVEKRPQWQRSVDMHQCSNVMTIASIMHFACHKHINSQSVNITDLMPNMQHKVIQRIFKNWSKYW